MGIASMVIGIIAIILAFIPFCGFIFLIPAVIALILGIVDVAVKAKRNLPKGCGVAGIVLNSVAIIIIVLYTLVFSAGAAASSPEIREKAHDLWIEITNKDKPVQVETTENGNGNGTEAPASAEEAPAPAAEEEAAAQ